MPYLSDTQVTQNSTALDILNVLDILKNQDLYQSRLKELQDATRILNEGKYVGATMEQAKTLMEAAQAAKELAENEIKEKQDQLRKDREAQEAKIESMRVAVQENQNKNKNLREDLDKLQWSLKSQREQLEKDKEEFKQRRKAVDEKEIQTKQYYERYMQKMKAIQSIMES